MIKSESQIKLKLLFLFFLFFNSILLFAQQTYDEILLTNGIEYKGKVVEITSTDIRFSHKGETLVYSLPKTQVFRIAFASGRTEVFSSVETSGENTSVVKGNVINSRMVAVLPFRYMSGKGPGNWQDMSYRIQQEAQLLASQSFVRYELQPAAITNSILLKKGISAEQLRAYTMDELCSILGVGYIITGEVMMRSTGVSSSGSQTTYQTTRPSTKPIYKPGQTSTTTSSSTFSTITYKENYQTTVNLFIYNSSGSPIFSKSKVSVWSNADAYKTTLSYLMKRTPLH
ncbi:MAG: hypothetical protein ACK5DG_00045 [Chitinophagaceae bacterium]|jgi:hypothetical protein